MTTAFENLSVLQKTRAALHRDVRAICTETCHFLGLEVTKPAMEIIGELVFRKLSVYGTDLEAFAKHAKRTTINPEDVKLLVRRNASLKTRLNNVAPTNPVAPKEKRRKTTIPTTKQADTTAAKNEEIIPAKLKAANAKETKTKDTNAKETKEKEDKFPDEDLENMITDTIDLTFD